MHCAQLATVLYRTTRRSRRLPWRGGTLMPPATHSAILPYVDSLSALFEGWSDAGSWTIILPQPVEVRQLAWSDAAHWAELVAGLETGTAWDVPAAAPFAGGWAGFISYDAPSLSSGGSLWEELPPEPPVWFGRFDRGVLISPEGMRHVIGDVDFSALEREVASPLHGSVSDSLAEGYREAVESIRRSIAAGDVYQVNLTRRFSVEADVNPMALYRLLAGERPPVSSALIQTSDWSIASASPEILLVHDAARGVGESRPIKGTFNLEEPDAERRLLASAKDASEHLMIVDLVRNDLGRVARPGGVRVSASRVLRRVGHILHLESSVRADAGRTSVADLLRVLLPAGSITGAPKRRAVAAIRALEPVPRGVYTGSIGFIDNRGQSRFSVAIRTAVIARGITRYHAGGGIVWDSDPAEEDTESRLKAERFLRWSGGW